MFFIDPDSRKFLAFARWLIAESSNFLFALKMGDAGFKSCFP